MQRQRSGFSRSQSDPDPQASDAAARAFMKATSQRGDQAVIAGSSLTLCRLRGRLWLWRGGGQQEADERGQVSTKSRHRDRCARSPGRAACPSPPRVARQRPPTGTMLWRLRRSTTWAARLISKPRAKSFDTKAEAWASAQENAYGSGAQSGHRAACRGRPSSSHVSCSYASSSLSPSSSIWRRMPGSPPLADRHDRHSVLDHVRLLGPHASQRVVVMTNGINRESNHWGTHGKMRKSGSPEKEAKRDRQYCSIACSYAPSLLQQQGLRWSCRQDSPSKPGTAEMHRSSERTWIRRHRWDRFLRQRSAALSSPGLTLISEQSSHPTDCG